MLGTPLAARTLATDDVVSVVLCSSSIAAVKLCGFPEVGQLILTVVPGVMDPKFWLKLLDQLILRVVRL